MVTASAALLSVVAALGAGLYQRHATASSGEGELLWHGQAELE